MHSKITLKNKKCFLGCWIFMLVFLIRGDFTFLIKYLNNYKNLSLTEMYKIKNWHRKTVRGRDKLTCPVKMEYHL